MLYGQRQVQYNHFIGNQGLLNPAYTGTRESLSGIAVLRNQWMGIEGAPVTQALNIHSPIGDTPLGLGLSFSNESMGAHNNVDMYGAAAYKLDITRDLKLSLGLQLGFNSYSWHQSEIQTSDMTDNALYGSSNFSFNSGVGAYLYSPKYFIGFSIPEFFTNIYDRNSTEFNSSLNMRNVYYYLYGGYVFEVNDQLAIKPSLLSRTVYGAPLQLDWTCSALLYQTVWAGITYKSSKEMVLLLEYVISNSFTLRYSFDYPFTDLNQVKNYGSHEIGLQFDFVFDKPVMRSIRYF